MPEKTSLPNMDEYAPFYSDYLERAGRRDDITTALVDQIPRLQAATQLRATRTWRDSNAAESETRIDNVVLEIEYGEVEAERIGDGGITALRLINNLEINEEILYGRMEKIEQSTLVP